MSEAPAFQRLDESGRRSHRPDGVGRRRPDTDTKHVADADHPLSLGLGLAKQRLDIAGEGTPYFDVESGYAGAPEHNLGLGEHRARTHADREGRDRKIERAASGEDILDARAMDGQADLAMAHIDQRTGHAVKPRGTAVRSALVWICAHHPPFVGAEPEGSEEH